MKKIFLITSFSKLKYKFGSKLIFIDEYLQKLYKKRNLIKYKYSYANDLNSLENYSFQKNFNIKNKLNLYRRELSRQLNKIHNKKKSTKYWGLIIDYFLIVLINSLKKEIQLLKNAKKKAKNIYITDTASREFFFDTESLNNYILHNKNYQIFIRNIIGKQIGIKVINKNNQETKSFKVQEKRPFLKYISNYLSFFFRLYIYIFKPILILDGSFGKKNSLKIFFRSWGRIFFLPSNRLFPKKKIEYQIDKKLRSKIKVKEKDFFDKIFNLVLYNFIPLTYLEAHNSIIKQNSLLSKKIYKIGGGSNILYNDKFKFLVTEILSKKGKLLAFQHGGSFGKLKFLPDDMIADKYATKRYLWTDKKGLGQHFLTKYKKISLQQLETNKKILLYPTETLLQNNVNNLKKNNHPELDQNYNFFENLKQKNKNHVLVKLFPMAESKNIKKIWKEKFNNVNFADSFSINPLYYYNSRVVVLNDISTPLYELMYIGIPFILVSDNKFNELNAKFVKKLKKLEKLKILHSSAIKAAEFLNKNYDTINDWWKNVSKEKNFINFKNALFIEKKDYINSITKDLISI